MLKSCGGRDDHCIMDTLLIEDDPSSARITREVLQQIAPAARVTIAESAEEVSFLLEQWTLGTQGGESGLLRPPEMVILDLGLPGMQGLELLERLRACPLTARVPIMIFTVSESVQERERAYVLGATMWVTKPKSAGNYRKLIGRMVATWERCFKPRTDLPIAVSVPSEFADC